MGDHELVHALAETLELAGADEWGVARNTGWDLAPDLPLAVSIVMRHDPEALQGLRRTEMSQAFFDDYSRLFRQLDAAAVSVLDLARSSGHAAEQITNVMSAPNDDPPLEDWGDAGVFPHKTAATQSGLGWIGKTAVFVSAGYGPAVRLTTVFTDMPLPSGAPVLESRCGSCRVCVDACPTGAGRDVLWSAGMPRDALYDEKACEAKTWEHLEWDGTCGVCQSVCPYTRAEAGEPPRAIAG
jgi:epoxyqueuosine reductase QueG